MNNRTQDFIDNTILSTPKPCASSTVERKEILKIIDKKYGRPNFDNTSITEDLDSSLGIIDIDAQDTTENAFLNLQKQRELAQSTLEKSKINALPSRFFKPSETDSYSTKQVNNFSTVNESDLLRSHDSKTSLTSNNFNPCEISTPRNSDVNAVDTSNNNLLYNKISDISREIRNSDVSLKDLCSQLNRFSLANSAIQTEVPDIDSKIFTPAELMQDQLLKDEMSWRKERDIPIKLQSTNISNIENSDANTGKYSLGGFFQGRSDNIDNDFFKKSPDRREPVPLVEVTNTMSDSELSRNSLANVNTLSDDSVISISQIRNILSEYGTEDTPRILNCLANKKCFKDYREDVSNNTMSSEKDVDEFLANRQSLAYKNRPSISSSIRLSNIPGITTSSPTYTDIPSSYFRSENTSSDARNDTKSKTFKTPETALCISNNYSTKLSPHIEACVNRYLHSTSNNSPIENKENDGNRSLTSVRSGSSLDTIPEGKFPIKSNRLELVWGCVKVGRTMIQEFQIRNQLNQRIRMQAAITGSSFRIVKDSHDSEMQTVCTFMLRPQETKTFAIMFCPTMSGAAAEKINFHPILCGEIQHTKRQVLTLYGYGGHVNCEIINVAKDSHGKLWLPLGKLDQPQVQQKFIIKNNGNLVAFASLEICSKGPLTSSALSIEPREFVISPQKEVSVLVRYNPTKSDVKFLNNVDVVEVGLVKLITGPEAIRGRIRRLFTKLKQKGSSIDPLVERLSKPFPSEKIPSDIMYLKESVSATKELLQQLSFKEISLTIEKDLESTLVSPFNIEESSIYHTLYQDDEDPEFTLIRKERLFKVEPTNILLTFPMKTEDAILLHSNSSRETHFKIKTEQCSIFGAKPMEGDLAPYETTVIRIFCKRPTLTEAVLERIVIEIENETVEITVKGVFIKLK